jgi:hypothetical protein
MNYTIAHCTLRSNTLRKVIRITGVVYGLAYCEKGVSGYKERNSARVSRGEPVFDFNRETYAAQHSLRSTSDLSLQISSSTVII